MSGARSHNLSMVWQSDPGGLKALIQAHFPPYPSLLTELLDICEPRTAGATAALGM